MAYKGSFQMSQPPRNKTKPLFSKPKDSLLPESLLKKIKAIDLQDDDLLMLLILYLMYRESGDKELLITMGALLLG